MPDIFTSPSTTTPSVSTPGPVGASGGSTSAMRHAFSSFMLRPEGITFETQIENETIILFLRKHWITNLHWIVITAILIVLPPIIFPALFFSGSIPFGVTAQLVTFLILSWYLLTFTYMLGNFLIWYFTVSIITEERVVDVDLINLLYKEFSETRISKIEDVTMKSGGFIKSFFDFGDVFVQTAGSDVEFEFLDVPHPDQVVRIINQLMGREEEKHESG